MRISKATRQSGVSSSAIRYYEQLGLLDSVARTATGYRDFSDHDVQLLIFLRKARDLGFTLSQCQELLGLVSSPGRQHKSNVERTRKLAVKRVADIDKQITELDRMRELVQLHIDNLGELEQECPVTKNL